LADGSVELIYIVDPQPLIAAVQSVGNRELTDQDIAGSIEGLVGTPVDPTQLDRAARDIEKRYREKGYYNTLVTIDQQELASSGIVLFRVREGERTKVTSIQFQGNRAFSAGEIRRADLKTKEAWLLGKGPLDNELIAGDVATIISFYRDRGYLNVRAGSEVTTSPNGKEALVTFDIEEGPVYTLRSISFRMVEPDEQPVFTNDQFLGLMTIHPGDVYSEDKLKKSLEAIREAYGKLGYADVEVSQRPLHVPQEPPPLVDTVLLIKQGKRFRTGEIIIQGNTITRDDVVRRNITLQPERPLDTTAAKDTELRLKHAGLFDQRGVKVTLQPENTAEDPGYRDVLVQVQETNTGKFAVGASVGSDSGVVGQISVTQSNFDVTDFPDSFGELLRGEAFRGGGQTFTIQLLPGTRTNVISMGLSDPALFESNYSGSANVFYRTRDWITYTEQRYGGQFSIGEHFGSRWSATIPIRIEDVSLHALDADDPTDYFKVQDPHLVSGFGIQFSRSSVDNVTFPTKGNRIQFGLDQFVGDFNYNILHADYATYLKLSEDVLGHATTMQVSTSTAWMPQSADQVPFYERKYLGGENFRGFDYRGIGPVGIRNDNGLPSDQHVGGTFSFFAGAEVRQPIYEDIVSLVGFVDTGTIDNGISFSNYRVSVGVGVRVVVPQISPLPFAFDFGFPVLKESTDKTRIFTFTVDVPFR
jgi:outer membrane protein insertion porin family